MAFQLNKNGIPQLPPSRTRPVEENETHDGKTVVSFKNGYYRPTSPKPTKRSPRQARNHVHPR